MKNTFVQYFAASIIILFFFLHKQQMQLITQAGILGNDTFEVI